MAAAGGTERGAKDSWQLSQRKIFEQSFQSSEKLLIERARIDFRANADAQAARPSSAEPDSSGHTLSTHGRSRSHSAHADGPTSRERRRAEFGISGRERHLQRRARSRDAASAPEGLARPVQGFRGNRPPPVSVSTPSSLAKTSICTPSEVATPAPLRPVAKAAGEQSAAAASATPTGGFWSPFDPGTTPPKKADAGATPAAVTPVTPINLEGVGGFSPDKPKPPEPKPKPTPPPPPIKGKGKNKPGPGHAPPLPTAKAKAKAKVGPPARKPDVKPGVQVKKLYWNSFRIQSEQSTIWDEIEKEGPQIDLDQLEALFADEPVSHGPAPTGRRSSAGLNSAPDALGDDTPTRRHGTRRIQVLDAKRRKEVVVMLNRLPATRAMYDAVFNMEGLTTDQLELLLRNLPHQDETNLLRDREKEYTIDEHNVWDTAEDFLLTLISVPQFQLRVEVWSFENEFNEIYEDISKAESAISSGCETVLTSQSIRHLLALVLHVGNYLNGGTPRGRADGFDLDTLAKMRTVKMSQSSDKPGTLVDFVTQQMERHYPGELESMFEHGKDVECIRAASRYKLADTLEELGRFQNRCEGMIRSVEGVLGEKEEQDAALVKHDKILQDKLSSLVALRGRFDKLNDRYKQLCVWFYMEELKNRKTTDEFFGIWSLFMTDIDQARKEIASREHEQMRRQRSQFTPRRSLGSLSQARDSTSNGPPRNSLTRSATPRRRQSRTSTSPAAVLKRSSTTPAVELERAAEQLERSAEQIVERKGTG